MGKKVGSRSPLRIPPDVQGPQSLRISLSLCSETQENARNTVGQIYDAEHISLFVWWMP